jgi:hypothetical protein
LPFEVAFSGIVIVVMPAIDFDNEMGGRAEKIDDVGTDRCLASEVRAECGEFFYCAPQGTLVRRRTRS